MLIIFLKSLTKSKFNKWMSTKTKQDYSQKAIFKDKGSYKKHQNLIHLSAMFESEKSFEKTGAMQL